MAEEKAPVTVAERIVLNKFEGDLTEEEMETATPLETIVIEKGEIVEHIIHEGG